MSYKAQIDETIQKLNNYSFDSTVYDELYKKAFDTLQAAYEKSDAAIDAQLESDRRQAVGDNALQTRSLAEQLAAGGLSSSGESAMLRINQAVSLNNALATLGAAATDAKASLAKEKGLNLFNLERELAGIKSDAMEGEQNRLYQRLAHLEGLAADDAQFYSGLAQSAEEFDKEYALKEKEYLLKYDSLSGDGTEGSDSSDGETEVKDKIDGQAALQGALPKLSTLRIDPDTDPEVLAKNIVNNDPICKGEGIYSAVGQASIYKSFARIVLMNSFSDEYINEMLTYLQSYGFSRHIDLKTLTDVDTKMVVSTYYKEQERVYKEAKKSGKNEYTAYTEACERAFVVAQEEMIKRELSEHEISILNEILL